MIYTCQIEVLGCGGEGERAGKGFKLEGEKAPAGEETAVLVVAEVQILVEIGSSPLGT